MTSADDIAYLLLLVGPGFIAIQFRAWTSEDYRISDLQRITWSLLVSVPIFFALHAALRAVPWKLGTLDSPTAMLSEPFAAPAQFIIAMYIVGAVGGWSIGRILDTAVFNDALAWMQLDPTRHRDVWRAAFRDLQQVNIRLTDGTSFFGWAEENSSGLDASKRYVRVARAWRRRHGEATWSKLPGDRFILINADAISHIEFRPFVPANSDVPKGDPD